MIRAWLVTNKYFVSESFLSLKKLILESAKSKCIQLEEYNNIDIISHLSKQTYEKPDFVLFWDKDVKLASYLESEGIKVFNPSESIRICDDKSLTYLKLRNKGIKMPKTIFSPLLYYHTVAEDKNFIEYVLNKFSFPFVFKECFGSFGQQVSLINNKEELIDKIKKADVWPFIIQEFIKSSFGKDLRLYVVGNEVRATMKRENKSGDFRANIEAGGIGEYYEPNGKQIEMAIKVVKELGLKFGGVDLLFGENDEPIFCEANSNAYFNELDKISNIKIEDLIFDYIKSVL